MPRGRISGAMESPTVDIFVDMGHPLLNRTVDGFLKIGAVGASRAAAEGAYRSLRKGRVSGDNFEHALKSMCKEGAIWGTVGGVYLGVEYGMERIRGRRDWKNALLSGAVTGALYSVARNRGNDRVVGDAITGAAIATAANFVNHLAW